MRKTYLFLFVFFIFLGAAVPNAQAQKGQADSLHSFASEIEQRAAEKYFCEPGLPLFRYEGQTKIDPDESINGNVLVVDGDLQIRGQIQGDVLVLDGDVSVKSGARVNGNITSINGVIRQSKKSTVSGNQLETHEQNLFSYKEWDDESESLINNYHSRHYGPYSTLPVRNVDESVILSFNRVQGMFIGYAIPKKITGKYSFLSVHGFGGYGFKEKAWRYEVGADRWLFNKTDYRFELGAKIYDLTDTRDNWLITSWENSLAAALLHRDYQDYYRRSGYEFHASQNLSIFFKGTLAFRNDDYASVKRNTNWSLFAKNRVFRDNPAISEGNMRSLYGELYFDNRNNIERPTSGWYAKLGVETSNSKLNSDFSFNQYVFELRRYQPLGRYERMDMRVKLATSEGTLPLQKLYQLGGVGSLRGFSYKSVHGGSGAFGGDRMLLANMEYNLSPKTFGFDFLFFDDLRYILFADAGNVWNRSEVSAENNWAAGFSQLKLNDIKSDIGLAISSASGDARLSIAKRTDTNINPIVVTFRLSKPF